MTTEKTERHEDAKLIDRYRPLGLKAVVAASLQQKPKKAAEPAKTATAEIGTAAKRTA